MTIDRIRLSIQTVKDNIAIMESEDVTQDNIDAGYYLQLEHEKFVLESLEKQMPKKLRCEFDNRCGVRNIYCYCPSCNSFRMEKRKYCSICGQALDWNDTE